MRCNWPRCKRRGSSIPHETTSTLPLSKALSTCGKRVRCPSMCVIRYWNRKKAALDHIVLVTTDQHLTGPWIVRHYEERPEIEQDYEQMKSGGWQLTKLSSTRYSEIVFYIATVVLSYSLYHLFANTRAGARFADKTRQALAFDQLRSRRTHVIAYAGGYFEIFETLSFARFILQLPASAQERLHHWLDEHLHTVQKRE